MLAAISWTARRRPSSQRLGSKRHAEQIATVAMKQSIVQEVGRAEMYTPAIATPAKASRSDAAVFFDSERATANSDVPTAQNMATWNQRTAAKPFSE